MAAEGSPAVPRPAEPAPGRREVERCLEAITRLSAALADEVRALAPADWERPSNCPPWRVRDLAAHIVSSGEGFVANIRRGLASAAATEPGRGEPAPVAAARPGLGAPDRLGPATSGLDESARLERQRELESADPALLARALQTVTHAFVSLYDDLSAADLATICFHRRGNRSVAWYAAHRLAEVAFHRWDLQRSLGQSPTLDADVASLLLPTLLESNAPRTYAAGLSPERGTGERYWLAVSGDPTARWRVTIEPERLDVRRASAPAASSSATSAASPSDNPADSAAAAPADSADTDPADSAGADAADSAGADAADLGAASPADLEVSGAAPDLALLVYGRAQLDTLAQTGAVRLAGNRALVARFAQLFPRP